MASARNVRDSDTALWLHNKLGSSDELWISPSIGTILKNSTIDNIYRCFQVLTTNVKLKLLLGILHLPRRNLEEMKHTIEGLIELALNDTDQWVRLIANILKPYPMTCKLSLDLRSNEIASNILQKLEEKVRDAELFATLPIECQYVNKSALHNLVGNQPPAARHFALKRKPKSATLRAELMQKSNDASQGRGPGGLSGSATVPVKHRDMTRKFSDSSPMRGIPKAQASQRHDGFTRPSSQAIPSNISSQSRSRYSGRQERGTKLLDISEQPIASRDAKRRKKQQELEQSISSQPEEVNTSSETPDYAVKLASSSFQSSNIEDYSKDSGDEKDMAEEQKSEEQESDLEEDDKMETDEHDQSEELNSSSPNSSNALELNYSSSSAIEAMPATPVPILVSNKRRRSSPAPPDVPAFHKPVVSEREEEPIKYAMPATPSPFFQSQKSRDDSNYLMTPPVTYNSLNRSQVQTSAHAKPQEPARLEMPPTPGVVSHEPQYSPSKKPPSHMLHATVSHPIQDKPNNLIKSPQTAVIQNSPNRPPQVTQPRLFSPPNLSSAMTQQPNVFQHNIQQTLPQKYHMLAQAQQGSLRMSMPQQPLYMVQQQHLQQQQSFQLGQAQVHQAQQSIMQPRLIAQPNMLMQYSDASTLRTTNPYQQQATLLQQQQQRLQEQQQQAQPQRNLKLTREQMFEAQEMFRTANRLKRSDKSYILGFMAGSRENPYPEKGDVLPIVLSEHEQTIQNPQGGPLVPVIVETIYEMNYRTGTSTKKQRVKSIKTT